jgi:nucleotide-binding universal stress UspA family protein
MGGSIVCGVDGSADSQAALDVAARLAERLEARLVLAHVAELALAPYAAVGRIGVTGIAPRPITLATGDEQEEAGARLLEHSLPSAISATPSREWSSAFPQNGSPIWPKRRMPS